MQKWDRFARPMLWSKSRVCPNHCLENHRRMFSDINIFSRQWFRPHYFYMESLVKCSLDMGGGHSYYDLHDKVTFCTKQGKPPVNFIKLFSLLHGFVPFYHNFSIKILALFIYRKILQILQLIAESFL